MIRNLPLGKNAKGVASAVIDMLLPFKNFGAVKTITTDNGPEFAEHETISKKLDTSVFFADPEKKSASNCRFKNFSSICISSCILVRNLSLADNQKKFLQSKYSSYLCRRNQNEGTPVPFFIVL